MSYVSFLLNQSCDNDFFAIVEPYLTTFESALVNECSSLLHNLCIGPRISIYGTRVFQASAGAGVLRSGRG